MMDEIMESRCAAYESEISELRANCIAELTKVTTEYKEKIEQMQTLHQEEISSLNEKLQYSDKIIQEIISANKIYEAQIEIVKMMCEYKKR